MFLSITLHIIFVTKMYCVFLESGGYFFGAQFFFAKAHSGESLGMSFRQCEV